MYLSTLCLFCKSNQLENEAHFHVNVWNNFEQRQALLNRIKVIIEPNIEMFWSQKKLNFSWIQTIIM